MTRHSTERLPVALSISVAGALLAVLAGLPEAALLAAPWLVLVALGMAARRPLRIEAHVALGEERVMVGDEIELVTHVGGDGNGLVRVVPVPPTSFWPAATLPDQRRVPGQVEAVSGAPVTTTNRLRAEEWGAHDLGSARIEVLEPYGLFWSSGAATRSALVRVHPTQAQLRELLTPWMVRRVSGTHASRISARGIEYADIRPFGPGDSVRDINWRVSARATDVWVSDRHPDRATDVVLLIDSFIESGHDVRSVFGMAVEAAIALAESHLGATDRVGLIEFGGLVRWVSPSTGRVQLQRLTDALLATGLYANAAQKELPIMPPRTLPPRSFVVALTPLLDSRFVDALFAARSRGHDVAVIECALAEAPIEAETLESSQISRRLWEAEQVMLRDRMAEQGIAVARWTQGELFAVAVGDLLRRRRRVVRVRGR